MNVYVDGSTTRICYVFPNETPVIIPLPSKVTSNAGEYIAILYALEEANSRSISDLVIISDSELAVNQIKGKYKCKHPVLADYLAQVRKLIPYFSNLTFRHTPREYNIAGHVLG